MNWYKRIKFAYRIEEDNGMSGTLVSSPNDRNLFATFEFQTSDSYTEIIFNPLSPNFGGMVYPSASYIAISLSGQVTDEIEKQIISQLMEKLAGIKEPKWDMGTNPMIDMLNKATGKNYTNDPDEVNMTEIPETEVLPLPSGVTVGTNPTLKIIRCEPGNASYIINNLLRNLEQIVQPFLENNLIDYYAIGSSSYGKKFVRSTDFQQVYDKSQDTTNTDIGYLKYVTSIVLKNYPALNSVYTEWLNNSYSDVSPQSGMKIDLKQSDVVQRLINDGSSIDKKVLNAVIAFDENVLEQMENLHASSHQKGIDVNSLDSLIYWLTGDNFNLLLESIKDDWRYFYPSFLAKDTVDMLDETLYNRQIDLLKYTVENRIPEVIREHNSYIIEKKVLPVYKDLNLPPEIVKLLDDFQEAVRQVDVKMKKQEAEKRRKSTFVLNWYAAFMNMNDEKKFTSIPDQYIDYGDTAVINELIVEKPELFPWYDHESAWGEAASRAEEYLMGEMGGRPSELYGEDKEEVLDDIKFYADDFVTDIVPPDQAEEFYDRYGDDEAKLAELITRNMYEAFIEWKQEAMREDEGDWEISSYDVEQKAHEIQRNDMDVEDEAFENGVMVVHDMSDKLDIRVHSKYIDAVKGVLKELKEVNSDPDNYNDSLSPTWPVEIYFTDKNYTVRKSLYEWINSSELV